MIVGDCRCVFSPFQATADWKLPFEDIPLQPSVKNVRQAWIVYHWRFPAWSTQHRSCLSFLPYHSSRPSSPTVGNLLQTLSTFPSFAMRSKLILWEEKKVRRDKCGAVFSIHSAAEANFFLDSTAKVRRSPAKRTKLVSLETPSHPHPHPRNEQKFALQASTLRSMCIKNTIWSLKCDFFEIPPPSQTNFVRFSGLLRTFAIVPKCDSLHSSSNPFPRNAFLWRNCLTWIIWLCTAKHGENKRNMHVWNFM